MAGKMGKKRKMKLAEMDVDEFMQHGLDTDSESDNASGENTGSEHAEKKKKKPTAGLGHKSSLEKLKQQDPEFYQFLESEDKTLLDFDVSEDSGEDEDDESEEEAAGKTSKSKKSKTTSEKLEKMLNAIDDSDEEDEDDDEDEDEDEEEDGNSRIYHKLPKKLEESNYVRESEEEEEQEEESDDESVSKKKSKTKKANGTLVTTEMVNQWSKTLQDKPSPAVIHEVVNVFKSAVHRAANDTEVVKYRVEGSTVFNAIIRMCLMEMAPALEKLCELPPLTDLKKPSLPGKNNIKWKKMRQDVKGYLTDLTQLLVELSTPAMVTTILKHVLRLIRFYAMFPKLSKSMLKRLIVFWSTGEETTRVMSFLCIIRLVHLLQDFLLESCIKQMYMAYVKNSKFTSPTVLPLINFMQRSLVELFAIDYGLAYQYAFIYIRQLAIHLRNAITVKKQDTCQAVYNWQYIHCLGLWVRLLSATYPNEILEPLIYPLTQTIIGTIKLLPTPRYYPLRFHCVRSLNLLSGSTDIFIPVLPFLLEIFEQTDFNKRHKSISFKPINFACVLKLSKPQLQEKAYKDGLIDQLYELLLEHFNIHSHSIGFPELTLPAVLQIKEFLKKCKVANYCKQIRQILEKVDETCKFIGERRKAASLSLSDMKTVEAWERDCKTAGTPLSKYYATWRKLRDRELQHEIAGKDRIVGKNEIPVMVRPKGPKKATEEDRKEFSALFDSDSEDSGDETRFLLKSERPRKKQKVRQDTASDSADYSDLDSDELEQLDRSGEEGSDDSSEDKDDSEEAEGQEAAVTPANGHDDSDISDQEDVVEDFEMSDSDSGED